MEYLKEQKQMPVYVKIALFFLATFGVFYLLYIGQEIILPLVFAGLFAVLLNPLVVFLIRRKIPRVLAITLVIVTGFILFSALITFICMQVGLLSDRLPHLQIRFNELIKEGAKWISISFDIKLSKVNQWIAKTQAETLSNSGVIIGATLSTVTGTFALILLIPIYVFMMLYYEPLFVEFIKRVFAKDKHAAVNEIIVESKAAMQHYLTGLLIEAIIVAIMNSIGLLMIGVDYAILWGILGALLNIIPYIGGVVAVALPVIMSLVTEDSFTTVWLIMLLYAVVQFIDNNLIVPKVVASRVQINALVSVIAVLLGGALWGVPGMFLSIPLIAVVKIICDRVDTLKPFGYLLGDSMPGFGNRIFAKRSKIL
jgi:predicted PurR-regulated permease PerM